MRLSVPDPYDGCMAWSRRVPVSVWVALTATASLLGSNEAEAARVVYLNADPIVLNADNGQDPTLDSYSTTGFVAGQVSGWPELSDEDRAEITYLMKEASRELDITYTWERPDSGTYDMLVMGTDADAAARFPDLGCSPAIGLADCDDGNAENISFFFYGCMDEAAQGNLQEVAHTMFTGLGFGWGLENTGAFGQIMGTFVDNDESVKFGTVCTDISGTPVCMEHEGCADGMQNETDDLLARVGARVDDGMPTLSITEPADLAIVDSTFSVAAEAEDGFGGMTVELLVVEAMATQLDDKPPYSWSLADVPDGQWTIQVTATDIDGNARAEMVTVCVGSDTCPIEEGAESTGGESSTGADEGDGDDTTGGGDGGSSTGGAADDDDDGGTSDAPIDPTGLGQNIEPDTGCQCRATPSGAGWAGLVPLLALGLRRRRG